MQIPIQLEYKIEDDLSKQEIFDAVCLHLNRQKCSATTSNSNNCKYRVDSVDSFGHKQTLKCAVGLFISDEEYQPKFDDEDYPHTIGDLCNDLDNKIICIKNYDILFDLQNSHDSCQTALSLNSSLNHVAQKHGLTFNHKVESYNQY